MEKSEPAEIRICPHCGQSMAAAAAWDGKINIEETVDGFVLGGGLQGRTC